MTLAFVCDLYAHPDAQLCHDCGSPAWRLHEGWRVAHEDFYVHDELWDEVCPDDGAEEWTEDGETFREGTFVLCIGCFEEGLGRQLTREDFEAPPRRQFGVPRRTGSDPGGRLRPVVEGTGARERI